MATRVRVLLRLMVTTAQRESVVEADGEDGGDGGDGGDVVDVVDVVDREEGLD